MALVAVCARENCNEKLMKKLWKVAMKLDRNDIQQEATFGFHILDIELKAFEMIYYRFAFILDAFSAKFPFGINHRNVS